MIRRFLALFRRRNIGVIIARRGERLNNRKTDAVAAYIERNSILAKGPRK